MNCTRDEALKILAFASAHASLCATAYKSDDKVLLHLAYAPMDALAKLLGHRNISREEYEKVGRTILVIGAMIADLSASRE